MKPDAMIVDKLRGMLSKRWKEHESMGDPKVNDAIKHIALTLQGVRDYGTLTFRPTHGGWWELIYTNSKKSGRLNLQGFGPALFNETPRGLYRYKDLRLIRYRLTRMGISKSITVLT